ncbi:hypothetical protein ILUMI_07511, partial [Ignelater luminosus]
MGKNTPSLSRRPTSRSRTKRVQALKKTLENNRNKSSRNETQEASSSPLKDLETVWEENDNVAHQTNNMDREMLTSSELHELPDNDLNEQLKNAWGTDEEFERIMSETLNVEVVTPEPKIVGNRIVQLSQLLERTIRISEQHARATEDQTSAVINTAAVWGTLATGSTFQHTNEFLSVLNIPSLSGTMFYTIQEDLSKEVIIGRTTKQVLYMGVRNKFCIVCTRANNKNSLAAPHTCFKNSNGSSASMEADIIVQEFSMSEEMHGVRYTRFIADGDSSIYLKIQEKVPYEDCPKAIYDNAHGDVATLIEDLQNGPLHVFGQHTSCKDYYGSNVGNTNATEIPAVRSSGLYRLIQGALSLVIRKANCLVDNETNNRAELFMSILARFTMGKRLNLIQRRQKHKSDRKKRDEVNLNGRPSTKRSLDYGPTALEPELTQHEMNNACDQFLQTLKVDAVTQLEILNSTVGQFDNPVYRTERANRLTASNFGLVVKRREHTSCHSLSAKDDPNMLKNPIRDFVRR